MSVASPAPEVSSASDYELVLQTGPSRGHGTSGTNDPVPAHRV